MNTIARPAGDQALGISDRRLDVLLDVALNVLPFAVTEAGVTLRSEVDGVQTITPEDIGAESGQASHALIGRGRGDLVGLEEVHARGGQLNHFGQIDRDQLFHASQTHGGVLQHVERAIVAVVSQHVAKSERVNTVCLGFKTLSEPCYKFLTVSCVTTGSLSQSPVRSGSLFNVTLGSVTSSSILVSTDF